MPPAGMPCEEASRAQVFEQYTTVTVRSAFIVKEYNIRFVKSSSVATLAVEGEGAEHEGDDCSGECCDCTSSCDNGQGGVATDFRAIRWGTIAWRECECDSQWKIVGGNRIK